MRRLICLCPKSLCCKVYLFYLEEEKKLLKYGCYYELFETLDLYQIMINFLHHDKTNHTVFSWLNL